MIKLKNQFKIIYLCLITFIGLLFIDNTHQLMAMNNGHTNGHFPQNNNNNILENRRTLHDLLLNGANLNNAIYNAIRANRPQNEIIELEQQERAIYIQSENIRRNISQNLQ
ncbi:MAG: SVM family protein [Lettuce witches'-broom phytoplasma]